MMIIIDYGLGNLHSVINKLHRIDAKAKISSDIADIEKADKLILPGVGFFATGMQNIAKSGYLDALNKRVLRDKAPILGICLGMQLLAEHSDEGDAKGLGWIKGDVKRFTFGKGRALKVPHMGWNDLAYGGIPISAHRSTALDSIKSECPILKGVPKDAEFYFVHSYHYTDCESGCAVATTKYGYDFTSVVHKGNIYGVQFHPEKSHRDGMTILKNFAGLR